jgi:serine/threonine protein phosphatase PrpC
MVHAMASAEPELGPPKDPKDDGDVAVAQAAGPAAVEPAAEQEALAAEPATSIEPPPVVEIPMATAVEPAESGVPVAAPVESSEPVVSLTPPVALPEPVAPPAAPPLCPLCRSPRVGTLSYCDNCGLVFPDGEVAFAEAAPSAPGVSVAGGRLMDRYEVGELIAQRGNVCRYRALDHGAGTPEPVPVVIVRAPAAAPPEPVFPAGEVAKPIGEENDDEIFPSFDFPTSVFEPATVEPRLPAPAAPGWPSLAWERDLIEKVRSPVLPQVVGNFLADGFEYLVEEVPSGQLLWDAWDDPDATSEQRFGWLKQVAEGLNELHQAGAMLEGLRPDIIVVTPAGQAVLTDLSDLLPLPLPPHADVRGTLYSAPELIAARDTADARADLYSFGAMVYALHIGRELTEQAFERPGVPKPFIPFFPDIHPLFARLISKTFCSDPLTRFPTDEASKDDPSGFAELIRTLDMCRRTLSTVRLDIASWTTTGIVRTGNEDAFAVMHAVESRQDDLSEYAVVLLADGMGGYEAGEVAAALAIQTMRKYVLQAKLFAALAGNTPPEPSDFNLEACKQVLLAALKEANRTVHTAARSGVGRRGMGCTAEAVYVDGRHIVVGHVGDSRTYHLHEGRLIQLTRDQTLVGRLVELGQLTPEEAENHPRRSELQQAIGGRTDVDPELYQGSLKAGDWVLVCSDGLSNHVKPEELKEMLQSEATSAEMAARRLVNLANLRGATDNATVVVIRAS